MTDNDTEQTTLLTSGELPDYSGLSRSKSNSPTPYAEPLLGTQDVYEIPSMETLDSVTLSWRDVHASIEKYSKPSWLKSESVTYFYKDILKRVSGIVEPGEMVGIIGPKGAGKTSLLRTLAHKKMDGVKVTGTVQVNGWPLDASQMGLISAYLEEQDNFMDEMTVRETFMFHAKMRMDRRTKFSRMVERVNTILEKLELLESEHCKIGGSQYGKKGLADEERKLLSLGLEMMMNPLIMFLEEPVKGMEFPSANGVLKLLKKQRNPKETIILTMSQPSSEAFALLDKVCLMADGHMVFLGEGKDAVKFFDRLGRPCPEMHNPADHFINELALKPKSKEQFSGLIETYTNQYKDSDLFKKMEEQISYVTKINQFRPDLSEKKKHQSNQMELAKENLKRSFLVTKRVSDNLIILLAQSFITCLFILLAFVGLKNDQNVGQNKAGLFFYFSTFHLFCWSSYATNFVHKQFPVFQLEYKLGMNGIFPFFLSNLLQSTSLIMSVVLLQFVVFYFATGLHISANTFFTAWFAVCTIALVSATLGIFTGCVTSVLHKAKGFNVLIGIPLVLLGGLYLNDKETPYWLVPIKYLSPIRYGFNALMANEFTQVDTIDCNPEKSNPCVYHNGTEVLDAYGVDPVVWYPYLFYQLPNVVGWCLSALLATYFRVRN